MRESLATPTPAVSPVLGNVREDILHPMLADLNEQRSETKTEAIGMAMPAGESFAVAQASDCQNLEVRYNNSCVFVLNMQSTFDFEIRPLADGVKNLFVEVRQSGHLIARETPMVLPRRGSPICFGLNYTPRNTHAGKVSFMIVVGYRLGGQPKVYAAYRTHTIYSGKEDPHRVCENLVVEVKNNIQQGHAGDVRVDQSFKDLREALRQHNTIEIDKEFLDLINSRPFWTSLALAECSPDSVPGASAGAAHKQHLELRELDGTRISILTQNSVRIGRSRDCEILARVLDKSGLELRAESISISQYHALIEWANDRCWLKDGGHYPKDGWRRSTGGVWVDGKRVPADGEFSFAPGREHRITLGDPVGAPANRYELSARLWSARELPELNSSCQNVELPPHAPVCLVLRRLNGPGWVYLVLRSHALLAWADSRCGAACVCLRQGALCLNDGQTCESLMPGRAVRVGSLSFQVIDTKTTG